MRRLILFVFAPVLILAQGASAQGRGSWSGGGHATVHKMRRVSVPQPGHVAAPEHFDGGAHGGYPTHYGGGARITQHEATRPPAQHADVMRDQGFSRSIRGQEHGEMTPNHYYWHSYGGMRYAHYYHGGVHWYGFYHGPSFYWTRWYGDHWWWYDARFNGRWVYWWGGFWWWPGPAGVMYVYVDNDYYPYDPAGVTVVSHESYDAPAAAPAPGSGAYTPSPDGKRLVQITGADGNAYLYDKTTKDPTYMTFMARGAQKVRFSGGTGGAPLQILLEFKDGTFALFDADGKPIDAKQEAAPAKAEPPPSGSGADAPPPPPGGTQP